MTVHGAAALRYWGCTRASGTVRHLVDVLAPKGEPAPVSRWTFAGPYVAALVAHSALGIETDAELDVGFFDLSGRRQNRLSLLGDRTTERAATLLQLLLTSSGRLAWLQHDGYGSRPGREDGLRTMEVTGGGPTTRHRDDAAAGTITQVVIRGTRLTWKHAGARRSATLQVASPLTAPG